MTTARDILHEANQTAPAVGIRLDRRVRCTGGEARKSLRRGPLVLSYSPAWRTPRDTFPGVSCCEALVSRLLVAGQDASRRGHIASPRLKLSRGEKYSAARAASTPNA
jgi:hypothetical protein